MINKGGFRGKGWGISGDWDTKDEMLMPDDKNAAAEKVLRVAWSPVEDKFYLKMKLFRKKEEVAHRAACKAGSIPGEDSSRLNQGKYSVAGQ